MARSRHRGYGETVLDGLRLGRRGLYVRRYASRNGRRASYGFPKPERRRYHRRDKPAGTRVDDCRQSREDGKYDEYPRAGRR